MLSKFTLHFVSEDLSKSRQWNGNRTLKGEHVLKGTVKIQRIAVSYIIIKFLP
jgi:hypothetical protein